MIALAGSFRIASGQRDAAIPVLTAMVEASRSEPGCIAYSFAFDALDDHLVRVFELFTDAAALQAHRDSPHMATFRAAREHVGFHARDITEYDIANARPA